MRQFILATLLLLSVSVLNACDSSKKKLQDVIEAVNKQCPMQVDEFTTLSSASLEGGSFVYNYSVDESFVSIDVIEQSRAEVKASLKQRLSTSDPALKQLISVCKEANTGISYKYVGSTSGKVCIIKFSPSEL